MKFYAESACGVKLKTAVKIIASIGMITCVIGFGLSIKSTTDFSASEAEVELTNTEEGIDNVVIVDDSNDADHHIHDHSHHQETEQQDGVFAADQENTTDSGFYNFDDDDTTPAPAIQDYSEEHVVTTERADAQAYEAEESLESSTEKSLETATEGETGAVEEEAATPQDPAAGFRAPEVLNGSETGQVARRTRRMAQAAPPKVPEQETDAPPPLAAAHMSQVPEENVASSGDEVDTIVNISSSRLTTTARTTAMTQETITTTTEASQDEETLEAGDGQGQDETEDGSFVNEPTDELAGEDMVVATNEEDEERDGSGDDEQDETTVAPDVTRAPEPETRSGEGEQEECKTEVTFTKWVISLVGIVLCLSGFAANILLLHSARKSNPSLVVGWLTWAALLYCLQMALVAEAGMSLASDDVSCARPGHLALHIILLGVTLAIGYLVLCFRKKLMSGHHSLPFTGGQMKMSDIKDDSYGMKIESSGDRV